MHHAVARALDRCLDSIRDIQRAAREDEVVERPRWEVEDVVQAGDRLVVESRVSGRGRSSGVPAEMVVFQVVTIRHGKAVRLESYLRREEALAAVGGRDGDPPRDAASEQVRADADPPGSGSPGFGPISES
jgi:ketosteroid isomerase-like protein